jgi:hypothetical protein
MSRHQDSDRDPYDPYDLAGQWYSERDESREPALVVLKRYQRPTPDERKERLLLAAGIAFVASEDES